MDNFYELLDLDARESRQKIEEQIKELNKELRRRSNHKDAKIRNEATDKLKLVQLAMVKFRSDEDRAAYDKELEESKKQEQLTEPLMDVDFYQFLELPQTATVEQIQQKIEALEKSVGAQSLSEQITREQELLKDARATLLDVANRKKYDDQWAAKREFTRKRELEKPISLKVGGTDVYDWISLEGAFEDNPDIALFLLRDGEVEAWLRWSLGQKQRANWVQAIAARAQQSDTPFMEYEEMLRLVNANRPLVLYDRGGRPGSSAPCIGQTSDVAMLADKHWKLFIDRFEYILDWIGQYGDSEILQKYLTIPQSDIKDIQLERLIYLINPQTPPPGVSLSGIADNRIDFGTLSKWETASVEITVTQTGRGFLYGALSTTADWIKLDKQFVLGAKTVFQVSLDRGKLQGGATNTGAIVLALMDGRIPQQRIDISVEQRTVVDSFKNMFKRKGG